MKCINCGFELIEQCVNYTNEKLTIINVPCYKCLNCNEIYYDKGATRALVDAISLKIKGKYSYKDILFLIKNN